MVRQLIEDFIYAERVPLVPTYNPNLQPPTGTVPVFYETLDGKEVFPELRAGLDIEFQDLEYDSTPSSIEYKTNECGFIVRVFGGRGALIKNFDLTIVYRDPSPKCNPPPPPPPPPPPRLPDTNHQFFIGAVKCSAGVTIGFYEQRNEGQKEQILLPGAGIFAHKFNGKPAPPYLSQDSESNYNPRNVRTRFPGQKDYGIFRVQGSQLTSEGNGTGIGGAVWYSIFSFSQETLRNGNGYINLNLPELAAEARDGTMPTPWTILSVSFFDCESETPPPPLPPPPPILPMSCRPNCAQNDQLLRLILKRIGEPKEVVIFDEDLNRKGAQKAKKTPQSLNEYLKLAVERTEIVNRIVGIENFPITVPNTMIEPHKDGIFAKIFGFIDGTKKRKINTITEFIAWMSEQDSAVLGQFHQVIEFESGEKDKKGKPEKSTVVLPNVAEALKEIVILTAQMAKQNNVQTELLFKMASEVVATRASAHKASLVAQDIQDYLDYPTETKSSELKTSINLPQVKQNKNKQLEVTEANEDYKKFLKQGKIKIVYDDWTGDNSLHDQLLDLLQLAAMMRAVYYQRTDK